MRPKGSAEQLEERRRRAMALVEQGLNLSEAARAVGVSHVSVVRWRQAYRRGGEKALSRKPPGHIKRRLTAAQLRRLPGLLLQGARKHGYSTDLWTLRRVAEVIEKKLGVEYHPCHVWKVLRAMGWSSQKPEKRARERDEGAIADWRQKEWPRIKKSPERGQKPCIH